KSQLGLFLTIAGSLRENGIDVLLRHCANSAATICHPESRLDMVRCGVAVYGLYPSETCRGGQRGLRELAAVLPPGPHRHRLLALAGYMWQRRC
ncbi:MAG: alanine racemase, partial [Candidatus Krumholzibacteria bacterium]|nr:alanine racemase [Candidatus Krumholzibacteria bacterium]